MPNGQNTPAVTFPTLYHFGQLPPGLPGTSPLMPGVQFNIGAGASPGSQPTWSQQWDALQAEMVRLQGLAVSMNTSGVADSSMHRNVERGAASVPAPLTEGDGEGEGTGSDQTAAIIEVIHKPKGEAGSRQKGYNLQDAMRMTDDKDLPGILGMSVVRLSAVRAGIKYHRSYRRQDLEVISNVCKLVVKNIPYLTKKRFPTYWPITEALKQHINNRRSYLNSQS
ncbi:hypothetical protein PM082_024606 [Marasmius tenuissimus]|nr:hypothetical protein PM082_024606 [Marasmius tenuissimus]